MYQDAVKLTIENLSTLFTELLTAYLQPHLSNRITWLDFEPSPFVIVVVVVVEYCVKLVMCPP